MTGPEAWAQKQRLFALQRGECFACESMCRFQDMTRHHVMLRCLGGPDDDWNIALICNECNDLVHHPHMGTRSKKRHSVLRWIFTKKGFDAEERNRLYTSYQRFGSGIRSQSEMYRMNYMRIPAIEYDRWRDDGGQ